LNNHGKVDEVPILPLYHKFYFFPNPRYGIGINIRVTVIEKQAAMRP